MTRVDSLSGQSWPAYSREEQLRGYHSHLKDLIQKLDSFVNVHTTYRLEDNHSEVMEAIGRLDSKVNTHGPSSVSSVPVVPSVSSLYPVIPPPPIDIFTGRKDYLKTLEEAFVLSGSSVRKEAQRIFVLYGSGGMGKTQLALKFMDLHRERWITLLSSFML